MGSPFRPCAQRSDRRTDRINLLLLQGVVLAKRETEAKEREDKVTEAEVKNAKDAHLLEMSKRLSKAEHERMVAENDDIINSTYKEYARRVKEHEELFEAAQMEVGQTLLEHDQLVQQAKEELTNQELEHQEKTEFLNAERERIETNLG